MFKESAAVLLNDNGIIKGLMNKIPTEVTKLVNIDKVTKILPDSKETISLFKGNFDGIPYSYFIGIIVLAGIGEFIALSIGKDERMQASVKKSKWFGPVVTIIGIGACAAIVSL